MILILIDNDHVRVMTVEIDTARCALSIFLLQDINPLSESRSRSVPLYAGDGHPLIEFARASRRKVKITSGGKIKETVIFPCIKARRVPTVAKERFKRN